MKTILLEKLMENYINESPRLFASEEEGGMEELFKWKAVQTFQIYWDLDIPDDQFKQMVENSFKDISVLMVTKHEQGLINLIKSLDNKQNIPLVREYFKSLLETGKLEGVEIYKKSDRVSKFVDNCNKIIKDEGFNKGAYWKWTSHTALAILALRYPKHNCFFKYKEVRNLADYLDYEHKIYSGKTVSISPYYYFCQKLKKHLLSNPQIVNLNKNLLETNNISVDDDNNILVWDFINSTKYFIPDEVA